MTVVSNDPSFWPIISSNIFFTYWAVASSVVVVYDWALTIGQEIELIWKQRWSLMTMLYLVIRYVGIVPHSVVSVLPSMPSVSLTDAGCIIVDYIINGINIIVAAMLGVIMIARLYAMCQRSRMMLIFIVIIFLTVIIACGVIAAIELERTTAEELILSGTYMCKYGFEEDIQPLTSMVWMLNIIWEVLALCLAVWIAVKQVRDLRRLNRSTGSSIGDCFRVLIASHVLYFASFAIVSCLQLVIISPELKNSNSMGVQILFGTLQILYDVQMFVLGPRLILSVREYHAKLVADSDAETSMTSIVFQERVHVPTNSTV